MKETKATLLAKKGSNYAVIGKQGTVSQRVFQKEKAIFVTGKENGRKKARSLV